MIEELNISSRTILWIDIGLFAFLLIVFLLVLLTNNIYLQFLTATLLIVIGFLQLFFVHLEPHLLEWKDAIVDKYLEDKNAKSAVNIILTNKLILEIVFFTLVFWVVFLLDTIIYWGWIRRKYKPRYNLKNWKHHLWKGIYLIFVFIILAYLLSPLTLLIKDLENKSNFNKVVKTLKLDKWIKRKNKYNALLWLTLSIFENDEEREEIINILEDSFNEMEEKAEKKEIFIESIRNIKQKANKYYEKIKESEVTKNVNLEKILASDDPLVEEKIEVDKLITNLEKNYQTIKDDLNFLDKEKLEEIEKFLESDQ